MNRLEKLAADHRARLQQANRLRRRFARDLWWAERRTALSPWRRTASTATLGLILDARRQALSTCDRLINDLNQNAIDTLVAFAMASPEAIDGSPQISRLLAERKVLAMDVWRLTRDWEHHASALAESAPTVPPAGGCCEGRARSPHLSMALRLLDFADQREALRRRAADINRALLADLPGTSATLGAIPLPTTKRQALKLLARGAKGDPTFTTLRKALLADARCFYQAACVEADQGQGARYGATLSILMEGLSVFSRYGVSLDPQRMTQALEEIRRGRQPLHPPRPGGLPSTGSGGAGLQTSPPASGVAAS